MISPESVERFLDSTTIDYDRIENPAAYLQTALFDFLESQCSTDASLPTKRRTSRLPTGSRHGSRRRPRARRRREEAIARGEYQD